ALAKVFEDRVGDGAVGNGDDGTLLGAQFGGAKPYVFDRAALVADAAGVADLQSLVGEDGDAAEEVLKGLLRAETDGQAADAETPDAAPRQSRGHVDAEAAQCDQSDDNECQDFEETARKGNDGTLTHSAAGGKTADDARGNVLRNARDEPIRGQGHEDPQDA